MIKLSQLLEELIEQEVETPNDFQKILTAFKEGFKRHEQAMRDSYSAKDYVTAKGDFEDLSTLKSFQDVVDLVILINGEDELDSYLDILEGMEVVEQKEIMSQLEKMVKEHIDDIEDVLYDIGSAEDYERTVRSIY